VRIRLRPSPLESTSVMSSSDSLLAVLDSGVNAVNWVIAIETKWRGVIN
jgi:hypothetical protein